MRFLTLAVLCTTGLPLCAGIIASSTFDNPVDGVDGWTIAGDGTGPAYVAVGGNPGGYITTTDAGAGSIAYFVAPAKFLGNQSAALGGTLTFDLRQSITGSQFVDQNPFVRIAGNGVVLSLLANVHPGSIFTSYSVTLTPSAGWTSAGLPASLAQMQNALANVTDLRIRAEYAFLVGDVDDLDNVVLNSTPEPSTALLLAAGCGLLLLRRRGR